MHQIGWIALLAMAFVQNPAPQESVQRQGPFTIAGQSFTVVIRDKRLEILDASGTVQYQKSFANDQRVSASARLMSAGSIAGLLIRYVRLPARPGAEESWQIFRLRDGKLAPLDLLSPQVQPGIGAVAAFALPVRRDQTELKVWSGNFYAIVPARIDWQQGVIMKGEQCFEGNGRGGFIEHGCDMRVEATRKPVAADLSFVRMLPEPSEGFGPVRHLVLKKDAGIEYLGARALVEWSKSGDEILIRFSNPWLKVLLNNNDDNLGWVHTDEDFSAVGLPAENTAP